MMLPKLLLAGVPALWLLGAAVAAAPPARIVSINICGDLLALSLAPRERVRSVTFLASDPMTSPIAARAVGIVPNHGMAEEVLALDPDLVLAGRYTARATVNLLRRLDYPVLELDIAETLEEARAQIRTAAAAMGTLAAGERMIAALDARIEAARGADHRPRPLAVVYGPNGFTLGPRSLSGALVAVAGFDNLAERVGILRSGHLSLEQLLLAEPDVLILEAEHGRAPAMATQILAHPALDALRDRITFVQVPRALWSCPGPWLADALQALAAAHAALGAPRER